jgi:hypothetical protein
MLDMARKAVGKVSGLSHDGFDADENLRLALTHLIQIIGEAGRRVSPDFAEQHPDIPWQEIVGMRHKVVHRAASTIRADDDVEESASLSYAGTGSQSRRDRRTTGRLPGGNS